MTTPNPGEFFTPFLPATFNIPEEEDRLRTYLNDKLSMISDVVNDKRIGLFVQDTETINGEKWFFNTKLTRNGYQAIKYIPSFVSGAIPMPIMVTPQFVITQVWGSASKPPTATGAGNGDYFSFMNAADPRISFTMSDTTITITTDGSRAAYSGFIVIQYLRNGV